MSNAKTFPWFVLLSLLTVTRLESISLAEAATQIFCDRLDVSLCSEAMGYNHTMITPAQQQLASQTMEHFRKVIASRQCHRSLFTFLCMRVAPICLEGHGTTYEELAVLPCRSFCERMRDDCEPKIHEIIHMSWSSSMVSCSKLPTTNCADPPDDEAITGYDIIPHIPSYSGPDLDSSKDDQSAVVGFLTCPGVMTVQNSSSYFSVGAIPDCAIPCTEYQAEYTVGILMAMNVLMVIAAVWTLLLELRMKRGALDNAVGIVLFMAGDLSLAQFATKAASFGGSSAFCDASTDFVHQASAVCDATCVMAYAFTHLFQLMMFLTAMSVACILLQQQLYGSHANPGKSPDLPKTRFTTSLYIISTVVAVGLTANSAWNETFAGNTFNRGCDVKPEFLLSQHVVPHAVIACLTLIMSLLAGITKCLQLYSNRYASRHTLPGIVAKPEGVVVSKQNSTTGHLHNLLTGPIGFVFLLAITEIALMTTYLDLYRNGHQQSWEAFVLACHQNPLLGVCTQRPERAAADYVLVDVIRLLPGLLAVIWLNRGRIHSAIDTLATGLNKRRLNRLDKKSPCV